MTLRSFWMQTTPGPDPSRTNWRGLSLRDVRSELGGAFSNTVTKYGRCQKGVGVHCVRVGECDATLDRRTRGGLRFAIRKLKKST